MAMTMRGCNSLVLVIEEVAEEEKLPGTVRGSWDNVL